VKVVLARLWDFGERKMERVGVMASSRDLRERKGVGPTAVVM